VSVTLEQAHKVSEFVNAGLVSGLGQPVPGQMCIEAAICLAMGEPHGDTPSCVGAQDRSLSLTLNDAKWSSEQARADGMRRLAIAQLGSKDLSKAQQMEWLRLVVEDVIRKIVPFALRAAAPLQNEPHRSALKKAATQCEQTPTPEAAARAAAYTAHAAAADAAHAARATARAAARATKDEPLRMLADIAVDAYAAVQAPGYQLLLQIEGGEA